MIPGSDALVFDTGPLRHFATHGWLGVLHFLADGRDVYVPDSVERELISAGAESAAIRSVLESDWIRVFRSTDTQYQRSFAEFYDRLVVGDANVGECGVLAMGTAFGCQLVIDDATPRTIAEERGLSVTATVRLLCDAIRARQLTTVMVEQLADDLIVGDYYLPFRAGGFRNHVLVNGLLDWEEL